MEITALVENRISERRDDLESEHGLSLHIEHKGKNILFDTGASEAFARNAEKLGIQLQDVDLAIISHHHYDHGGGLPRFLSTNSKSGVYLGKRASGDACFKMLGGAIKKYIGLDNNIFSDNPGRFFFIEGMAEIASDVSILTDICSRYPRPKGNSKLFMKDGDKLTPDRFDHELLVVLKEKEELVILTGCAHSGILNMVESVARKFPGIPIKALFGGFHLAGIPVEDLMPESRDEIEEIGKRLLGYNIGKIYTGHCTGLKAYKILKEVMGKKLEYMSTGTTITL